MRTAPKNPAGPTGILDQAAAFLREAIATGRIAGVLPPMLKLSADAGVSVGTIHKAIGRLATEGLISVTGKGRGMKITVKARRGKKAGMRSLRVGILLSEKFHAESVETQMILNRLAHDLEAAGHSPFFSLKTQIELKENPTRILASVRTQEADAWIAFASSYEVLRALLRLKVPVLDFAGALRDLEIASTSIRTGRATQSCVRQLVGLGHRRIVMICGPVLRGNSPLPERPFARELEANGIHAGQYNMPDWDNSADGLQDLLKALFHLTPPTAIISDEFRVTAAILAFAASRGLRIPHDFSLVTISPSGDMEWMRPKPATFVYDLTPLNNRIVKWINACATSRQDRDAIRFEATFDPAESIAPPPQG